MKGSFVTGFLTEHNALRFINIVACIITSFPFIYYLLLFIYFISNVPLYGFATFYLSIHLLMDIFNISTFWLL